ncbi:Snf7 [Penicillium atrosanguineum]|uniref:Snf7 n=1 Tax=Penicillium atrosanguineum TaxID=1132637 RepID=A0A9W9PQQ9_9EURO|nr:Snf7 [Penicillium atrosanguineum]KAJ5307243.1 Snf7 [Penicillium atrosanguineum]
MGNTGSSQKISSQDRAILDLKNQRDKIKQYQVRITVLTDRETEIARQCLARNDRRRALLALRRKKYQETLLDKTNSQLLQLEQLTSQVEFALVQKDVMYGLQQGTQVLQTINREMGGIEGVERLMGENEEARAYQEEVSRMLEGNLSNQDEDEVEDELEALRLEVAPKVPQQPVLPDAPVQQPVTSVPEREEVVEETRTALPA